MLLTYTQAMIRFSKCGRLSWMQQECASSELSDQPWQQPGSLESLGPELPPPPPRVHSQAKTQITDADMSLYLAYTHFDLICHVKA